MTTFTFINRSIPYTVHSFLDNTSLYNLRLVNKDFQESTKVIQLCEMDRVIKNIQLWNLLFPRAICANISNNHNITNDDFTYFKKLLKLNMSRCRQITDNAFIHLTNLLKLDVSGCINLTSLAFQNLINLQKLNLSGCRHITNDAIIHLINLKKLNVTRCSLLTDNAFTNLKKLKVLIIYECHLLTDNAIQDHTNLEVLDISGCLRLTDNAIINLTNLKELYITKPDYLSFTIDNITENCFRTLTNLTSLDISSCNRLGSREHAISHLTNLKYLKIGGYNEIRDDEFTTLTNLTFLDIGKNETITGNIFQYLTQLKILNLYYVFGLSRFMELFNDHFNKSLKNLRAISIDSDDEFRIHSRITPTEREIYGLQIYNLNSQEFINQLKKIQEHFKF